MVLVVDAGNMSMWYGRINMFLWGWWSFLWGAKNRRRSFAIGRMTQKRYMKMLYTKERQVEELTIQLQATQQVNETVPKDLMASRAQNLELQEKLTTLQEILQFINNRTSADLIHELQDSMKMNNDNWDLQLQFAEGT
ncbi:hypothetical protein GQ457_03G014360 [Hibiscus cannabinus]